MKVEGFKVHKERSDHIAMFFDLTIDGVKTWCVRITTEPHDIVVIHWGGSRYFNIEDYNEVDGDICEYLENNLENLPLLDDYDWDTTLETITLIRKDTQC